MRKGRVGIGIVVGIGMVFGTAVAAPRDVMIRSIDTVNRILELHNFGSGTEDLSGYQFCSHDENQVRQYSQRRHHEDCPQARRLDGLAVCGWQDTRTGVALPMARDSLTGGAS